MTEPMFNKGDPYYFRRRSAKRGFAVVIMEYPVDNQPGFVRVWSQIKGKQYMAPIESLHKRYVPKGRHVL